MCELMRWLLMVLLTLRCVGLVVRGDGDALIEASMVALLVALLWVTRRAKRRQPPFLE